MSIQRHGTVCYCVLMCVYLGVRLSLSLCQGEDQGVVTEFVNPKFKDSTRTAFTKATRLECMMQVGAHTYSLAWKGEARPFYSGREERDL